MKYDCFSGENDAPVSGGLITASQNGPAGGNNVVQCRPLVPNAFVSTSLCPAYAYSNTQNPTMLANSIVYPGNGMVLNTACKHHNGELRQLQKSMIVDLTV